MTNKDTIFSGIKATGRLHVGNYLGAVKNWVDLQDSREFNTIYSIVDLHSITIDIPAEELRQNVRNMAIDLMAVGIDPKKSLLFIQSHVPEHTELAWIFNCILPISELEKMTQFKDKAKTHKSNINAGLFDYPALMAADILLYRGTVVPVGEDQDQHVELTRKIAKKFNNRWSEFFAEPKTKMTRTPRLMSLTDPNKKMSKDLGDKSYIALSDSADTINEKISKAVTDSDGKGKGGRNLLDLFTAFVDDPNVTATFEEDYKNGELQYSKLKPMLAHVIVNALKPIQAKRAELEANPDYVDKVLAGGAESARAIAAVTMNEVRKLVGLD
jgi:tryptophanyl-tRNA synthetase